MFREMCKKMAVLLFVLVPIIMGLISPATGFGKDLEKRVRELERKVEELEGVLAEYKALLKLKEKGITKQKTPEKVAVIIPEKEVPSKGPSVWSKYNMQFDGRIKIDTHYDDVAFNKYNDFIGVIAAGKDYKKDSVNFNPRDTRLAFRVRHSFGNLIGEGRFENDFYGDTKGNNIIPRIRLAYVNLKNTAFGTSWLVGQDWTPVAQQNPHMSEFGIMAAGGNLWWRIPQITIRQELGDFELLGSLMRHRRISPQEEGRWPWMLGRIGYNMKSLSKGNMIALGFGYRRDKVKKYGFYQEEEIKGEARLNRWLAVLELKLKKDPFEFKGEGWVGQGIGSHWLRYYMGFNPLTGDEIKSQGGFLSLFYKTPIKRLSLGCGAGLDHATKSDLSGWDFIQEEDGGRTGLDYDARFSRNMQFFANLWYEVTPGIKLIGEYIRMETERFSQTRGGNRFTFSVWHSL